MNNEAQHLYNKTVAYKIGFAQLAASAAIALALIIFLNFKAGYSALLGGVISGGGTLCLARIAFSRRDPSPQQFVRALYVGEFIKIVLTVALFIAAIKLLELNMLAFFMTYIATLMVYWIGLLLPEYGTHGN